MKLGNQAEDTVPPTPALRQRAMEFFQESLENTHRHTDRLFASLMVLQWLAGIAAAIWISPRGRDSVAGCAGGWPGSPPPYGFRP
jgi:hypothetical protein